MIKNFGITHDISSFILSISFSIPTSSLSLPPPPCVCEQVNVECRREASDPLEPVSCLTQWNQIQILCRNSKYSCLIRTEFKKIISSV